MSSRVLPGLIAGLLFVSSAAVAQTPRAFQLSDWYRVQHLSALTLSPDGRLAAFVVTSADEAENRRRAAIWIADVTGATPPRQMTASGFESTAPRWEEGGAVLSFTSARRGPDGRQVTRWGIRMDQGGEAYPMPAAAATPQAVPAAGGARPADGSFTVTAWNGQAGAAPAAGPGRGGQGQGAPGRGGQGAPGRGGGAPGGRGAATPDGPYAAMPPLARPPATAITRPVEPSRFDGRHFIDPTIKSNGTGFVASTGRGGAGAGAGGPGGRGGFGAAGATAAAPTQLYIQRGTTERLAMTAGRYSHRSPSVSPDGKWVVFDADHRLRPDSVVRAETQAQAALPRNRARDEADRNATDLYILPVAACEAKTAACQPVRIENFGAESNVQWSPDSRMLSFSGRAGPMKGTRLMVWDVEKGGKPVDLMGPTWPYEPGTVQWQPDGTIRLSATTGGSNGIYRVDPRTRQVTPILAGQRLIEGLQVDSAKTRMVYVSTDHSHPDELYVANYDGTNERKLTSFHDALNREVAWAEAERLTYKSVDDLEIEGWLMKPHGYEPGKRYPLVLYIHGGPHSMYNTGWFDEFQNLAAEGMFVLFTNPRGSTGINNFFTNASRGDWGGKDYIDIMRGVDLVVKRPDVDSTRMGVTGGSYGGFMTAWITTKTNRFKAAQVDRMISDWTSWWGSSDAQSLTNGEFFGRPWENQAMYDSLSPIRRVQQVKTPTLIVQSEEDHRTPMANAELWYIALRSQGVQAEFIRYPRSNHDLSRTGEPWLLVDRLGRLRQWFTHWLIDTPAASSASTASSTLGPLR